MAGKSPLRQYLVGRRPAGGGRTLHQRHRQVDAHPVTGQQQPGQRCEDAGSMRMAARREERTIAVMQHSFVNHSRAGSFRVQLMQPIQHGSLRIRGLHCVRV
jgi:hypothetical protein